jgi:dihydrofolate reductase
MAKLIYSTICSLDGYVADAEGRFDWCVPDEEVHSFLNDLGRPIGTSLYGRRMYEVMVAWETMDLADQAPYLRDYQQIWRAADKVVFSTTLTAVGSERTCLEPVFDPAAIREMKASAGEDISIGGPGLAAHAIRAGLVDAFRILVVPVIVGGGDPWLPHDARVDLELMDERRFGNGTVSLGYRAAATPG